MLITMVTLSVEEEFPINFTFVADLTRHIHSCHPSCYDAIYLEAESRREGELGQLRGERAQLKQRVEQQRATIQRFQQDEQQRMSQLKSALNTYFSTTPKLPDSDIM